MLWCWRIRDSEHGFTLMETLVAMSVLLVALAAFVPLYYTAVTYTLNNQARSTAMSLATREMEHIRNLPYEQVGLVGGNPSGVLVADRDERHSNGQLFHIAIRVWWVDDSFDGTAGEGSDSMPNDYKRAQVTVTKTGGGGRILARLSSDISRQSEEPPSSGGNIIVRVYLTDGTTPVEDAKVEIIEGPSSGLVAWTDRLGQVLFAELNPSQTQGDYSIKVTKTGYAVRPDLEIQTTTVILGQTRTLEFIMDIAGDLVVHLRDPSGNLVNKHSTLVLSSADMGDVKYNSSDGNFHISSLFPGNYEIEADAASYNPTSTPISLVITSRESKEINITLQPTPSGHLHLEVTDKLRDAPLGPASVSITRVSTGEVLNAETNSNGILETDLEVDGYEIEVSKDAYLPFTTTVFISQSGNTNISVELEPAPQFGSILVRAEDRSGNPRDNVWLRVVGAGYDTIQQTGSYRSGEALINNLRPGTYTVYRWGGAGWRFPRTVNVTAGNQATIVYSY